MKKKTGPRQQIHSTRQVMRFRSQTLLHYDCSIGHEEARALFDDTWHIFPLSIFYYESEYKIAPKPPANYIITARYDPKVGREHVGLLLAVL